MYNPDNEKLVAWSKKIMLVAGFWGLPISNNRVLQNVYNIYSIFMRINYLLFWLNLVAELVRLISNNYNMAIIAASLSVAVNATKIAVKVIIYLEENILKLFMEVIEKEEAIWQSESEEIKTLYRRKVKMCKAYLAALTLSTGVTVSMLVITGGIATVNLRTFNNLNNQTMETHFMYQTLFPLNKLNNFVWLFSTQAIWSLTAIMYNIITHQVFVTLLVYSTAQLEVLQSRLRNYIGEDFSEHATDQEINEKVTILKKLNCDHQYIIGFVKQLNQRTQYIIMMEFILSSLDMASVSVNLIKMDLSEMGFLMCFLVVLGVQLFLLGWNCNEIKVQSEAIADALYESKWYLLNKEAKRITQIMMTRAQTPLEMTIGPFGPMTTNSVFLVLKAAYSYVSIMRE